MLEEGNSRMLMLFGGRMHQIKNVIDLNAIEIVCLLARLWAPVKQKQYKKFSHKSSTTN